MSIFKIDDNNMPMLKKKYIDGSHWKWLKAYSSKLIHVDDIYCGFLSFVEIESVHEKLVVDYDDSELCLFDEGYKCMVFLPDNQNWCLSVVFNDHSEVVEWYFDMTKENSVDDQGNPFFIDLYLDISVSPEYKIRILDEDELDDALRTGVISKCDFDMAYKTCDELIENIIPNRDFIVAFFKRYLVLFTGSNLEGNKGG